MMLTKPPAAVAVEVTHLMKKAASVLVFGPVPIKGNLDSDSTPIAPIELTELTASIVEGDFDVG